MTGLSDSVIVSHMSDSETLPTSGDALIPTSEAVALLCRPVSTVHRWVAAGRLEPAQKLPGLRGPYLFKRSDVEALAAELAEDGAA